MKQFIRLEYNDLFRRSAREFLIIFKGISRDDLLRLCALFLARKTRLYTNALVILGK